MNENNRMLMWVCLLSVVVGGGIIWCLTGGMS